MLNKAKKNIFMDKTPFGKNIWKIINWEFVSTKYLDQTKKWKK